MFRGALFFLALPALVAASEDVEVSAALESDDQCGDDATCALNALQLKIKQHGANSTAAAFSEITAEDLAASGNDCTSGLVGKIHTMAPGCLDSCPEVCAPLQTALVMYLTKGGMKAAQPVICQHSEEYGCALTAANVLECKKLLGMAANFGINLPDSPDKLSSFCP